ncbi:MAG: hypothetical protein AAB542_02940 [Patescibacteria group bacterium]
MEKSALTDQPALPQTPTISPSFPPRVSLRPVYLTLTFILGILIGVGGLFGYQEYISPNTPVTTYDGCVEAAGSRIQESYPATCITRDGKRFTQPTMDDDGVNPIYTDPASCNSDNDCTVAIIPGGCCACPSAISKTAIGKDGWERYVSGKAYSKQSTCETFMACGACAMPSTPICRNNVCMFDSGITPTPIGGFTCPKSEWVDCMPGPLEGKTRGITLECTPEFLSWAEANCPNFKGAAY